MNTVASQTGGFVGTLGPNKPDFGSRGNGMTEAKRDDTVITRINRLEDTVNLLISFLDPYVGEIAVKELNERLDLRD